jgi:hypothetical protein
MAAPASQPKPSALDSNAVKRCQRHHHGSPAQSWQRLPQGGDSESPAVGRWIQRRLQPVKGSHQQGLFSSIISTRAPPDAKASRRMASTNTTDCMDNQTWRQRRQRPCGNDCVRPTDVVCPYEPLTRCIGAKQGWVHSQYVVDDGLDGGVGGQSLWKSLTKPVHPSCNLAFNGTEPARVSCSTAVSHNVNAMRHGLCGVSASTRHTSCCTNQETLSEATRGRAAMASRQGCKTVRRSGGASSQCGQAVSP